MHETEVWELLSEDIPRDKSLDTNWKIKQKWLGMCLKCNLSQSKFHNLSTNSQRKSKKERKIWWNFQNKQKFKIWKVNMTFAWYGTVYILLWVFFSFSSSINIRISLETWYYTSTNFTNYKLCELSLHSSIIVKDEPVFLAFLLSVSSWLLASTNSYLLLNSYTFRGLRKCLQWAPDMGRYSDFHSLAINTKTRNLIQ